MPSLCMGPTLERESEGVGVEVERGGGVGGRNSLQCTRLQASFSVFIAMVTVAPWPEELCLFLFFISEKCRFFLFGGVASLIFNYWSLVDLISTDGRSHEYNQKV